MGGQTIQAQERSIPNPFQDATAQGARRRPHFSLHFGLHGKFLIQLIYSRCGDHAAMCESKVKHFLV